MDIGKKSTKRLAKELADGWGSYLKAPMRRLLAQEIEDLLVAVIERANTTEWHCPSAPRVGIQMGDQ